MAYVQIPDPPLCTCITLNNLHKDFIKSLIKVGHADGRKSTQYSAFKNHKLQEQGKNLNKKGKVIIVLGFTEKYLHIDDNINTDY